VTSLDRAGALRPLGRPVRLARSVAAALVCVLAAAVGHVAAGGALPALAAAAVFAGAAPVAWLLSSRRVTPGQLTGLLVLCQVCVHLGAPSGHSGDMSMGPGMVLGHALATLVSAAVLARGERFVWRLAERLGLRAAPLLRTVAAIPSVRPPLAVVAPRSLRDVRLAHSRSLRGPPVSLA
jgi:hypothetical protein